MRHWAQGHHSPVMGPQCLLPLANLDLPTQSAVSSGVELGGGAGMQVHRGASGRPCLPELVNYSEERGFVHLHCPHVLVPPAMGMTRPKRSPNLGRRPHPCSPAGVEDCRGRGPLSQQVQGYQH